MLNGVRAKVVVPCLSIKIYLIVIVHLIQIYFVIKKTYRFTEL